MYKIKLLTETKSDLNIITDFIYSYTFSSEIVDNIYKDIVSGIYSLQIFPHRFKEYKNNIRVIIIRGKYKVFYGVNEESKTVTVYRIFSSLQNYENII
ncbi:MAG: type II toxin-antitoxin system RelE/ParE family toxin [Candidatus Gracilibacteria bacterium]|nr:type II toxin-antitoxin system RelE/ParE family toxin [Candidatus Gracilibacteria bacterium]